MLDAQDVVNFSPLFGYDLVLSLPPDLEIIAEFKPKCENMARHNLGLSRTWLQSKVLY